MTGPLVTAVQVVVDLLVRGEYEALASMTRGRRLNASQLAEAVRDYGASLISPPASAWGLIDAVRVEDRDRPTFNVVMPLWTHEEGRSDLSLSLTLTEFAPGVFDTEVDNIHVL